MRRFKKGQRVRFDYGVPAISCQWNGRRVTGEGVIVGFDGACRVLIDRGYRPLVRILPAEITHVRGSRWRSVAGQ